MKLDAKIGIGILSVITVLVISYFLYVKYHIVTYTKAEFIDANWRCSTFINKPITNTVCTPIVVNNITTVICTPQTSYYRVTLGTLNGNGINYQCPSFAYENFQTYYDLNINLRLKIFDSKEILYSVDNYDKAKELANRKSFIVGLNEDFEVVNYK